VIFQFFSSPSSNVLPTLSLPFLFPTSTQLNSALVSHTCLGFMLLSILIWWPNHLSFLLSTILVTSSWFNIPLIWLLLILSHSVFQVHFLKYLISVLVNLPPWLVNIVLLYEPQSSTGRQTVLQIIILGFFFLLIFIW
jgi:hypothetical protein